MFGWEFPPNSSGGLGTACYGLTKALSSQGAQITLVLPTATEETDASFLKVINANLRVIKIRSALRPYLTPEQYAHSTRGPHKSLYGSSLFEETHRYALAAEEIASQEEFDIIHCHDWMTFEAGIRAKRVSGRPLVVHVHATEYDRTGGHSANQPVQEMERRGILEADAVITVSSYTRQKVMEHYAPEPSKVHVVHNAVEQTPAPAELDFGIRKHHKIVLFLGRLTLQKGPDYFLHAAKKVIEYEPDARFVMAGTGDMMGLLMNKAAELGLADKVLFTGFIKGEGVDRLYRMADVYVMPSVSEPFGITALEAQKNRTPVIVSKNSGVTEVMKHCLKVDFWDTNQLASKIIGVLRYKELSQCMSAEGEREAAGISWDKAARKCLRIYSSLLAKARVS